ncbi:hypothetical protein BH11ACT6_BH11ACT6_34630 [soil metagenome]
MSPEPAVKHLRRLQERGLGVRKIAMAAGLAVSTLQRLPKRPAIEPATERAILSIPIPEIDTAAVKHRALCIAGSTDEYVSLQRKYRSKFIHQRAQLLAARAMREQIRKRREERERQARAEWLKAQEPRTPPARIYDPNDKACCGDCEMPRCQCEDYGTDDLDLWWIPTLADHDPQRKEVCHA